MTSRWASVWNIGYGITLIALGLVVAYTAIQAHRALEATFESRRSGAYMACLDREELKDDIRFFLTEVRGEDPAKFPVNPSTGRIVFEALEPGGQAAKACRWYAIRVVPESSRP